MAVLPNEIIDYPLLMQTLDCGYIDNPRCFLSPPADLPNLLWRESQKIDQVRNPLIEKLPAMNQYNVLTFRLAIR